MITVKVCYANTGKSADTIKVALGFDGILRGVSEDQWTDSDGEAHFDHKPGDGKVFIRGSTVYQGYLSGRVIVYI
jgi:hypothetical protein